MIHFEAIINTQAFLHAMNKVQPIQIKAQNGKLFLGDQMISNDCRGELEKQFSQKEMMALQGVLLYLPEQTCTIKYMVRGNWKLSEIII